MSNYGLWSPGQPTACLARLSHSDTRHYPVQTLTLTTYRLAEPIDQSLLGQQSVAEHSKWTETPLALHPVFPGVCAAVVVG